MSNDIPFEAGSGNVFADLGLPDAEEHLAKAELASRVNALLRDRGLTQVAAAAILGIDQPKVSRLRRGYLTNFSVDRLMLFLNRLGQDVDIVVRPADSGMDGRVQVIEGA